MSFAELGLQAELLRAIESSGYTTPTPIQAQAIPAILEGRDVLGGAQTGTGKTAAFSLPLLQRLQGRGGDRLSGITRAPRALVLTPTRELAAQVGESVRTYGRNLELRSTIIFGGVSINPQKDKLRRGVDVVIATPGRLLDHAQQGTIDLSAIEILVLDEADRMLDMGFIHDIRRIMKLLPKTRQNLMFSATYSKDIKMLADKILHNPAQIEVARRNTAAESVTQHMYRAEKQEKRDLLIHLIDDGNWFQVLVFMRTKHGSNKLAKQLNAAKIHAAAIHGNKSQAARTSALRDFKAGKVRVLVATDIAARGLDIERLPHVVNYELPNVPEDYVHRIGRTGRAGEEGAAVSLVARDEVKLLKDIQRVLKKEIKQLPMPEFEPRMPKAEVEADRPPRAQHRHRANNGGGGRNGGGRNGGGGNNRPGNASRNGGGRGRSGGARTNQTRRSA